MENIKELINSLAEALKGHNALIQVQVENEYMIRKVGDVNKLVEKPRVQVLTVDSPFLPWMESQVERAGVRPGTRDNHRNALRHLGNFRPDMRFSDIDYHLVCDFDRFLRVQGYAVNTVAKVMKIFRQYVNMAMDDDIFVTSAFRKYRVHTEKKERPTLTEREIRRIEDVETLTDEEERVKSTFLLATYTGLRYSDASSTRKGDVKTVGRRKWLVMRQRKTDTEVRIPVGSLFGGKALALIGTRSPNNARCNIVLKRLCKRSRIRKRVTMHTARRTCATVLAARGVTLPVVQSILGHGSVQTTEGYVNVGASVVARQVGRVFR